MASFQNLRDEAGSAPTLRYNTWCAMARTHAQTVTASRHAPITTPFLIASGQLLEIGSTRSKQRRKYFLIASFSGPFAIRSARSKQFVLAAVVWQGDDFLEAEAEFFEQGDGGVIGGL